MNSLSSSMSLLLVADRLDELLKPGHGVSASRATPGLDSPSAKRALEALHHFHHATSTNTKLSTNMGVIMRKVTQLAFEVRDLFQALLPLLKLEPLDPTTHARYNRRSNNPSLHSSSRYQSLPARRSIPLATDDKAVLERSISRNKTQHGHSLLRMSLPNHPHLHARAIQPADILRLLQ